MSSALEKLRLIVEAQEKCIRERECLPPMKDGHLAVVSTMVVFENLASDVEKTDIVALCNPLGAIDMVVPLKEERRTLVYMRERKSAAYVINDCRGIVLRGRNIEAAWAPSRGIMSQAGWKDYWDADNGVMYIPWDKLNEEIDYEDLEVGAWLDVDTMPEWLKIHLSKKEKEEELTEVVSDPQEVQPRGPRCSR